MSRPWRIAALLLGAALLGACGADAPPTPIPAREFDDPGLVTGGGYEMRYAAIQASSLPAEVTATYGIPQRSDRLVVNVSVLEHKAGGLPVAIESDVAGTWRRLVGEPQALAFRAVVAGGAVSYVAEAPLQDREPIVLELIATPSGTAVPLRARLTRQFDVD
jgi:hypothetical protein